MTLYVDDVGIPADVFNVATGKVVSSRWCHLISDLLDPDVELHPFATGVLGLRKSYFQSGTDLRGQYDPGHDHYDLTISKRRLAVANGAKSITAIELGRITIEKSQRWHRLVEQRARELRQESLNELLSGDTLTMEQSELVTLADARAWLGDQLQRGGAVCPCCSQLAKIYKRKLNSNMARTLIIGYRTVGLAWFHAPTTVGDRGELAKLRYWGLVEEEQTLRADGGRAGWWRVTSKGEQFILGRIELPAHALVYDGELLRLDESDGLIGIRAALGEKFSYQELMTAQLPAPLVLIGS